MMEVRWGTWEELVFGGAVLRHGVWDWGAVAEELRCRTLCPYIFTAETCKAKYEDLQERYFGCNAWFEELLKRRVAELRRELEKSEDSIGSLESKLESLKGAKRPSAIANHTGSPASIGISDGLELSSKDGLSSGSFTEETRTSWSSESQIPTTTTTTIDQEIKLIDRKETTSSFHQILGSNAKKRRGKRKRKDCSKEGSVGDNQVVVQDYEGINRDLLRVLNLIENDGHGSTFGGRLDQQRRTRYKRTIRRHMDLDTIRLRISNRTIVSSRELHRDLLLLCNNAMVFYPKGSREHVSAALLRKFVNITFQKNPEPFGTDEVLPAMETVKSVEGNDRRDGRRGGEMGTKGKKSVCKK